MHFLRLSQELADHGQSIVPETSEHDPLRRAFQQTEPQARFDPPDGARNLAGFHAAAARDLSDGARGGDVGKNLQVGE